MTWQRGGACGPTPRVVALAMLIALAGCAGKLTQPQNFLVFFPTDDATLTPGAQKVVAAAAAAAHDASPSRIVVEGRADGGTPHDASLADDRARAVVGALVVAGVTAGTIDKQASAPPTGVTGVASHQVIIRLVP